MRNNILITRSDPLYPSKTDITIIEVQKHRRLYNYLIQYWRHNKKTLEFPPSADLILKYVPQLCFVPCFFLAYTLCRVGELKQISITDIIKRKPFEIKSSKSKHVRIVPPLLDFSPALRNSIHPKTFIYVVSYDHLKNAIRGSKIRSKLAPIENILDLTHIFRHLSATFMFNNCVDIDTISYKLGHMNKDTTLKYIH
ncbi:MAG: site-specific integrase [Thermoplasmata archaeon]|nr:site-specific integrase [Thermoplasmata archaeon]